MTTLIVLTVLVTLIQAAARVAIAVLALRGAPPKERPAILVALAPCLKVSTRRWRRGRDAASPGPCPGTST
jgi:hypothetical protein